MWQIFVTYEETSLVDNNKFVMLEKVMFVMREFSKSISKFTGASNIFCKRERELYFLFYYVIWTVNMVK